MMISAIGRYFQKKELKTFIECLRAQDGIDIAETLIAATIYRNNVRLIDGIDLLSPLLEFQKNPILLLNLSSAIRQKQRSGEYEIAAGMMVWLHTIRSTTHPTLRYLGRELWAQLARGMPHVPQIANEGVIPAFVQGYDQYPMGLTPEPLP